MQIIISKEIGFCAGVKRALDITENTLKKCGKAFCVGPIIHNESVVTSLKEKGLIVVNSAKEIPQNSNVIIRAHGAERNTMRYLQEQDCKITDLTCPSVLKIIEKTKQCEAEGWFVVIFGNIDHPEVKAISSYLNLFYITTDINDFSFFEKACKFYIVYQTTFSTDKHEIHMESIRKEANYRGKIVDIFDSICYTTLARRDSCLHTASLSDAVVVLGDKNSNNTKELYNTTNKICRKVFFVSSIEDFIELSFHLTEIKKLGIVAGASTPYELILEVISLMESKENTSIDSNVVELEENREETESESSVLVGDLLVENKEEESTIVLSDAELMESAYKDIPDTQSRPLRRGQIKEVTVVCPTVVADVPRLTISFDPQKRKNDHGYILETELDLTGTLKLTDFIPGQKFSAVIKDVDQKQTVEFSKKDYDRLVKDEELVAELIAGKDVEITCTDVVTKQIDQKIIEYGLSFKVGRYNIFAPKSQLNISIGKRLSSLVGKKVLLRILPPKEADSKKKQNPFNLYAGQRAMFQEKEDIFWENFAIVGKVVKGNVVRYGEKEGHIFGAFVSVEGHDCLAHISELTWARINHPNEVLELGKDYNFVVLDIDRSKNKVSLGFKQLQKAPIDILSEKHPEGSVVTGKVERIMPFGAFVSIGEGIDGLVHISQISYDRVDNINSVLEVGQTVSVRILKYEGQKVSLSIKDLLDPPTEEETNFLRQQKRVDREPKIDQYEKPNRIDKKTDKPDFDYEVKKPKRSTKKFDIVRDTEPRDYISSTSTGATFGDTEQAKKLMQFEQEDDD